MKKWSSLFGFVALAQIVGGSSAVATVKARKEGWYDGLKKPSWTPSDGAFGPVWMVLFTLMGIAAWRVWQRREENPAESKRALQLWGVQLVLNAAWGWIFFGMRKPKWALGEIFVLWNAIILTMRALGKRDRVAGALFVPYLLWTSFAALITLEIARRNAE